MALVIDTNVWVAAAGNADQADADCVAMCADVLDLLRGDAVLGVDDQWRILNEYFDNLPKGSAEYKLLGLLMGQAAKIEYWTCEWALDGCAVVPDSISGLDPADRKFAAVALKYSPPAPVYNALDPGWQACQLALAAAGVTVLELCPNCLS